MEEHCQYEQLMEKNLGVSLKGRGLKLDTDEDASEVVKLINECREFMYLELEGNTLGVNAAIVISKALEAKPDLKVALWKDMFTGRLKTEIPDAMKYLFNGINLAGARLTRLDLSDNAIGPVGMVGFAPFFKSESSFSLKELIVNNNGLGPDGGTKFAKALLDCLHSSQARGGQVFQLKVFICGRNRLEDKAAGKFADFFKEVMSLEEVHMPQNGIYKTGLKNIAKALCFNSNLRVINLNDNTMNGYSVDALADTISCLCNLKELELGDCLLKNHGACEIVKALRSQNVIEKLGLESNEINQKAGVEIAEILRTIPSLNEINLGSNELGVQAIEQITRLLEGKTVLIEEDEGEVYSTSDNDEDKDTGDSEADSETYYRNSSELVMSSDDDDNDGTYSVSINETESSSGNVLEKETKKFSDELDQILSTINICKTTNLAAALFWENPTIERFDAMQPNVVSNIISYIKELYLSHEEKSYAELCILAAMKVIQMFGEQGIVSVYEELLMESLRNTVPNAFVTYLLVYLGFIKSEDKSICIPKNPIRAIYALSSFVKERPLPAIVLQCLQTFLRLCEPKQGFDKRVIDQILENITNRLVLMETEIG